MGAKRLFLRASLVIVAACSVGLDLGTHETPRVVAVDAGPDSPPPAPFRVAQTTPDGETLTAIWGADRDAIFAVGTNGLHADHFAGAWHRTQVVKGRDYYGVWGQSADEVYAVGVTRSDGRGIIQRLEQHAWRDEYVAETPLRGVWGAGKIVYAVGDSGVVYGKELGTAAWAPRAHLPARPDDPAGASAPILWGISGNSVIDFVVPAGRDRVFHYKGNGDFVYLDPAVDRTLDFRAVWGAPGRQSQVFLGSNYLGVNILTAPRPTTDGGADIDADSFSVIQQDRSRPDAAELFVNGIWGTDGQVAFVGDAGSIFLYAAMTGDLVTLPSPTSERLTGVWGSALDDVWIVGAHELMLHGSFAK